VALEAQDVDALRETLDRLRVEVAELRASRERLVLAADADRRGMERELHDGLQQRLVALAAGLELARRKDDAEARAIVEELARDVRQALDEAGKLAHRIYPPLLEAGGLAAALRAAAVSFGVPTRIEADSGAECAPEAAATVYFCCVEALERAATRATVVVGAEKGVLGFEIAADGGPWRLDHMRDRVEALGGSLTIGPAAGGEILVSGSLPLSR
jgi:signal transduction histidine kinase